MTMKNTKAELLAEVKKLSNELKYKTQKVEKLKMKLDECKFEEFKVLFEVSQMSNLYLTELRNKTSLVRLVVQDWETEIVYGEIRQFKDGNRVIMMFNKKENTDKELILKSALFLRKVKVL